MFATPGTFDLIALPFPQDDDDDDVEEIAVEEEYGERVALEALDLAKIKGCVGNT